MGIGLLLVVIIASVRHLPFQQEEVTIIPTEEAPVRWLMPQQAIDQEISVSSDALQGIIVFAKPTTVRPNLQLQVTTKRTAKTTTVNTYLLAHSETASRLIFPLKTIYPVAGDTLAVRLVHTGGEPIPLIQNQEQQLAVSALTGLPATFATRQGVYIGIALLLSLLILQWLASYRWLTAALLLLTIAPLGVLGFWLPQDQWGIGDWNYRFSLHEVYRQTILEHHQFPLWNPYICGGTAGLADPEFSVLSPTFLLELLFGIPTGTRLGLYPCLCITSLGMLFLSKQVRLSLEASFLAALITTYSSGLILKMVEGHVTIIYSFMWVPWILQVWLKGYKAYKQKRRTMLYPLLLGLLLTATFLQGGIYVIFYISLTLAGLVFLVHHPKAAWSLLWRTYSWFLPLAAFKLLPVLAWLRQFPDDHYSGSAATLQHFFDIFVGRHLHGSRIIYQQLSGWHEYGTYIGWFALLLAVLAGAQIYNRLNRTLVATVLATIIVSGAGPWLASTFDFLSFLPRSNISRLTLLALIAISILAGRGLDWLRYRLRLHPLLCAVLVGLIAIDLFSLSYPISEQAFIVPPVVPAPPPAISPLMHSRDSYTIQKQNMEIERSFAATKAGFGTFSFCSVIGPTSAVIVVDNNQSPPAAYLASGVPARLSTWSPNWFTVTHSAPQKSDALIVNMNYAEGWYANGSAATNTEGLLSANIVKTSTATAFRYVPPGLRLGNSVSIGTLLFALFCVYEIWRKRTGRPVENSL